MGDDDDVGSMAGGGGNEIGGKGVHRVASKLHKLSYLLMPW